MRVALISCGSAKQAVRCRARDMYTSALFRYSLQVAEAECDHVFIVSALYGLIGPDEEIAPYEFSVKQMSKPERVRWARRVVRDLYQRLESMSRVEVLLFAGGEYVEALSEALSGLGAKYSEPMAGLTIGRRLKWLKAKLAA